MKNLLIFVFIFYFTAQIVIHCSAQDASRNIAAEAKTPKTWVLLIGIDNYPRGIPALHCCTADTESLRNAFLKCGLDADYITMMNDNCKDTDPLYPNSTNIETQIKALCQGAGKDEDVVISFSGHGIEDKNTGEAFWATKNIVLKDNTVDKKTVISRRWVERIMRESKAAKKLLISDCCREEFNIAEGIKTLAGSHFKAADSFDEEYSRSLSKNVFGGKFTGFARLTSCSEGQRSREHRTKKNGVFTYFLVEGLSGRAAKDGKITLMDLYDYASVRTRAYVRTEFSSLQVPVMWAEGDENKMGMEKHAREFILANLPNNPPFKPVDTTTEIKPTTPNIPNKPVVNIDWHTPKAVLEAEAEKNNPAALCILADCYFWGTNGYKKDKDKASELYQRGSKFADSGNPYAQCCRGECYYNGNGVKQDYTEAVKWYRKAAEQNNAPAQCSLGRCYHYAYGVEKDREEAVKWYRKAAEQNYALAQYHLGFCYYYDNGDYTEAVKWYRKAAEQNYAMAQYYLGWCYHNGRGVKQDYTEAVKWHRKVAEQSYSPSQFRLGEYYYEGRGVEQDYTEAVKWYRKAAEQGDNEAKAALKLLEKKLKSRN
jgi:TPR repeat protein